MPELPEVETVCRGMRNALLDGTITQVELRRPDLRFPFPKDFAANLQGRRINGFSRRAKYILCQLDNGSSWITHLGMSGRVCIHDGLQLPSSPHDHVRLLWEREGQQRTLIYHDPRRFGFMTLADSDTLEAYALFAHLGPEPLSNQFHADYLHSALQRRKGPIKPVIMDQKLVVGVGNIYASEALFRSHIHPDRPAHSLTMEECERLVPAIREVLTEAIEAGGSSLRDYVDASGSAGYFQHRFAVYAKAGEPCSVCSTPLAQSRHAGRATYYCPNCQS